MRSVNVTELKNDLNVYLAYAEAGEEVVVRDNSRAVAKLVPFTEEEEAAPLPSADMARMLTPFTAADATQKQLRLAAAGMIRLPKFKLNWDEFSKVPLAKPREGASAVQALLDERAEGW